MVTSKTSQQRKGSGRGTRVVRVPSLSRRSSEPGDANRETERQQSHLHLQKKAPVCGSYQSVVKYSHCGAALLTHQGQSCGANTG